MRYIVLLLILFLSLQVNAQATIPWKVVTLDKEFQVNFKAFDRAHPDDYIQPYEENYIDNETMRAFYPRTRTKVIWRGLFALDDDYIEPDVTSHGYSGYNGTVKVEVQKLSAISANLTVMTNSYAIFDNGRAGAINEIFNHIVKENQTYTTEFREVGIKINNETLRDVVVYSQLEVFLELNGPMNWDQEAEITIDFHGHQNPSLYEYLIQNYEDNRENVSSTTGSGSSSTSSQTKASPFQLILLVLVPLILWRKKRRS